MPVFPAHLEFQPPKGSGNAKWVLVTVAIVIGIVLGTRFAIVRYIHNAKVHEARNITGDIALAAKAKYERDHVVCESASTPIPADFEAIRGRPYSPRNKEWLRDEAQNAGFACLGYDLGSTVLRHQYMYTATNDGFIAQARGDIDGDGNEYALSIRGKLTGNVMILSIDGTSGAE